MTPNSLARLAARAARDLATEKGEEFYNPGRPCKHDHEPMRHTKNGMCVGCSRQNALRYQKENKAFTSERNLKYNLKNRERNRTIIRKHYKKNKSKYRAKDALYRARKIQATPKWANLKAIEAIYEECRRITKKTRKRHEVDHIIPLRGKTVSGLHVENNLQIITKKANRSKSNKFE